jgi:hypothetical protein
MKNIIEKRRPMLEILEAIAHDLEVIAQARNRIQGKFDMLWDKMNSEKRKDD